MVFVPLVRRAVSGCVTPEEGGSEDLVCPSELWRYQVPQSLRWNRTKWRIARPKCWWLTGDYATRTARISDPAISLGAGRR